MTHFIHTGSHLSSAVTHLLHHWDECERVHQCMLCSVFSRDHGNIKLRKQREKLEMHEAFPVSSHRVMFSSSWKPTSWVPQTRSTKPNTWVPDVEEAWAKWYPFHFLFPSSVWWDPSVTLTGLRVKSSAAAAFTTNKPAYLLFSGSESLNVIRLKPTISCLLIQTVQLERNVNVTVISDRKWCAEHTGAASDSHTRTLRRNRRNLWRSMSDSQTLLLTTMMLNIITLDKIVNVIMKSRVC